jgi:hypothetical protein
MPPLLLDADEVAAVALGLRAAIAVDGLDAAATTALAKLTQVVPSRWRTRLAALAEVAAHLDWAARWLAYLNLDLDVVEPAVPLAPRSLGEEGEPVAVGVEQEELPAAGAVLAGFGGRGESVRHGGTVEVIDVVDLEVQRGE